MNIESTIQVKINRFLNSIYKLRDEITLTASKITPPPSMVIFNSLETKIKSLESQVNELHQVIGGLISDHISSTLISKISRTPSSVKKEGSVSSLDKYSFGCLSTITYEVPYPTESREDGSLCKNLSFSQLPLESSSCSADTNASDDSYYKSKYEKAKKRLDEAKEMLIRCKRELQKRDDIIEDLKEKYSTEKKSVEELKKKFLKPRDLDRDDTKRILPMLPKLKIGLEGSDTLDANACFTLWGNKPADREFIVACQKLNFPQVKKLTITNMAGIEADHEIYAANKFLAKAVIKPMKYLHLGSCNYVPLENYTKGIGKVVKLVTHQVYLYGFEIGEPHLKDLFENARKTEELVLFDAKVRICKDFALNPKLNYKIRSLDLFKTARRDEEDYLDEKKIVYFFEALAKTNLKDTLKSIHVMENQYPAEELTWLLKKLGFKAVVEGDSTWRQSATE